MLSPNIASSKKSAQTKKQKSDLIEPLVERHVGDAAFYWGQLDRSAHSPLLKLSGILQFEKLLTAHMDGIEVAKQAGCELAMKALRRWRGAGEIFVSAHLALSTPQREQQWLRRDDLASVLDTDFQRMARGAISALVRSPAQTVSELIWEFIQPDQAGSLQLLGWRAIAINRALSLDITQREINELWDQATHSSSIHVRTAACRATHVAGTGQKVEKLLQDADRSTSVEASIALLKQGPSQSGLHHLWKSIWNQIEDTNRLTGAYKAQATHRLARWIRYLGVFVPTGNSNVPHLLELLPARLGLSFLLHHADSRYLPWIQKQMSNPQCARLAAWTWSTLLGLDLERSGLALPPARSEEATHQATDDLDPGLPLPNLALIQQVKPEQFPQEHSLASRLSSEDGCRQLLRHAPQAVRWIAAQNLMRLERQRGMNTWAFDIRADARIQLRLMNAWGHPGSVS